MAHVEGLGRLIRGPGVPGADSVVEQRGFRFTTAPTYATGKLEDASRTRILSRDVAMSAVIQEIVDLGADVPADNTAASLGALHSHTLPETITLAYS